MSERHFKGLEALYASAPINEKFPSKLSIVEAGRATIRFDIGPDSFHGAGAAHGTIYFKMLDDAAFYAANSLVTDYFILTTAFNIFLTRPIKNGPVVAQGRWVSGTRRVLIAESWLTDARGEEVGRGTGTFTRSRLPLAGIPAYAAAFGG